MLLFSQLFTIACSVLLPLGCAIYLCIHEEGKWKLLLVGALTYVLFQMALFLPTLFLFTNSDAAQNWIAANYPLYIVFLSVFTPIFSELFRWLMIHVFSRNDTTLMDAFAFGIGYGGLETSLTIGMNVFLGMLIGAGKNIPNMSNLLLAEGVGQVCQLVLQVGYTLLIMQMIKTKNKTFLFIAIGIQILITLVSSLGQNIFHWNIWILLCIMVIFSLLAAMYIAQVYKNEKTTK